RQRHPKDRDWIGIEEATSLARPDELFRAFESGALLCQWVHPVRHWLAPWSVPRTLWQNAYVRNGKLWRNGVCLEKQHQRLVIDVAGLLAWSETRKTTSKKNSKAGAPPLHDWNEATKHLTELWGGLGDPYDPLNAKDKWRSDADIARHVV